MQSRRATVRDLRRRNRSTLLSTLFFDGPLSRHELGASTGLSAATVSNVTGEMIPCHSPPQKPRRRLVRVGQTQSRLLVLLQIPEPPRVMLPTRSSPTRRRPSPNSSEAYRCNGGRRSRP